MDKRQIKRLSILAKKLRERSKRQKERAKSNEGESIE